MPPPHARLANRAQYGPANVVLSDDDATLRDVGAWASATLELQLTPGARLPTIAERAAAAAAPPELIYLEVEAYGRRQKVSVVADAGWSGRRVALEIFARCAELEPATHTFYLAPRETGDSFFVGYAVSAFDTHARWSLRQLVPSELQAGRGLDPRQPIIVRPIKCGTPSESALRERRSERRMSRIAAVRELFTSLANRMAGSNLPIRTALITFDDKARVVCSPTPLIERFIADVRQAKPEGGTALWDALKRAVDLAADASQAAAVAGAPPPRRRVLVLSDGEDTCSPPGVCAAAVALDAVARGVIVDAMLIGEAASAPSSLLRAVAAASGGLCFAPATLRDALQQVELETVLSSGERPPASAANARTLGNDAMLLSIYGSRGKLYTRGDNLPPRRNDPVMRAAVVLAADTVTDAALATPMQPGGGGLSAARPAACVRRIIQEFRAVRSAEVMGAEMVAAIDVYPLASDVGIWRVVMPGWEGTAYVGGTFALTVRFPATYPAHPPSVRFDTPILHPNINAYGKVCAAILGPEWAHVGTRLRMPNLLRTLMSLFATPETTTPVNSALALDFYAAAGEFTVRVAAHVAQHASKSRQQWRDELERLSEGA